MLVRLNQYVSGKHDQTSDNKGNNQLTSVSYSCIHKLICCHGFSIVSYGALVKIESRTLTFQKDCVICCIEILLK